MPRAGARGSFACTMLILTRKVGQAIRVADDITVTILEVGGNQVRLGIEAPRQIAIHRIDAQAGAKSQKGFSANEADSSIKSMSQRDRAGERENKT